MVRRRSGAAIALPRSIGLVTASQPSPTTLKILVEAGILDRGKRGVWAYPGLVPGALDPLTAVLSTPR
jgi:hypothetical protein